MTCGTGGFIFRSSANPHVLKAVIVATSIVDLTAKFIV
jgi:hypothetical protein